MKNLRTSCTTRQSASLQSASKFSKFELKFKNTEIWIWPSSEGHRSFERFCKNLFLLHKFTRHSHFKTRILHVLTKHDFYEKVDDLELHYVCSQRMTRLLNLIDRILWNQKLNRDRGRHIVVIPRQKQEMSQIKLFIQ